MNRGQRINDIGYFNEYFKNLNRKLKIGEKYHGNLETLSHRRIRLSNKYKFPLNKVCLFLDFMLFRRLSKLALTRKIYFKLTKGRNMALSKAETYGRLYSCGFRIIEEVYKDNLLHFTAEKVKETSFPKNPTYGFLICLDRVGKGGKIISVWKLRTMHPYSEFLQEYVFDLHDLKKGGKFNNDFRITVLGRFLRKYWIDELPMLFNILTGDLKLVGVRPISQHYYSLYSNELQELRIKSKPGLIPPFYADMPNSLEEIMASEVKYLREYEKRPIATDVSYFLKALRNIIIKRQRSS